MTPREAAARELVVAEARTWLGTPYHPNQGCKGAGVDCAWILLRVYAACGLIEAFVPPSYKSALARMREGELFYRHTIERFAVAVGTARPAKPGDIALFRVPLVHRGRVVTRATHGAIVEAWPSVIHAYSPAGAVVRTDVTRDRGLTGQLEDVFTLPTWRQP